MHIVKDYPPALEFMVVEVGGNDLMSHKEATILFVDKYKQMLRAISELKSIKEQQQSQSKKEKKCQTKKSKRTQSKSKYQNKKVTILKN